MLLIYFVIAVVKNLSLIAINIKFSGPRIRSQLHRRDQGAQKFRPGVSRAPFRMEELAEGQKEL